VLMVWRRSWPDIWGMKCQILSGIIVPSSAAEETFGATDLTMSVDCSLFFKQCRGFGRFFLFGFGFTILFWIWI
jgi:hypothetical protein